MLLQLLYTKIQNYMKKHIVCIDIKILYANAYKNK